MNYHFIIRKEEVGYSTYCLELDGCVTQGDSLEELAYNAHEALNLYMDEPPESKTLFPLPNPKFKKRKDVLDVEVEPEIAFAFLMRRQRLLEGLTQQQMKKKLSFKNLFSYQKLESSKYANPTLKTLEHIRRCIPDFPFNVLF